MIWPALRDLLRIERAAPTMLPLSRRGRYRAGMRRKRKHR